MHPTLFRNYFNLHKTGRFVSVLFVLLLLCACQVNKKTEAFSVFNGQVETMKEPILSDEAHPRFSWMIDSKERGIEQTHYRILVSTSYDKLTGDTADVWDSGRIKSGQSIQVPYGGPALKGMTTYFFKVKVWCKGKGYATSTITGWTTGAMRESDWKAHWIGLDSITSDDRWEGGQLLLSARYLRRSIHLEEQPLSAFLFVTGVGTYSIYLNGLQLGGYTLSSTSTDATRRVFYRVINLTTYLLPGENVFTVVLGNGTYAGSFVHDNKTDSIRFPKMLFQLELTKPDGTHLRLISDTSWKMTTGGPIRDNILTEGEVYDGTREVQAMYRKGYNDASWLNARFVNAPGSPAGKAKLEAIPMEETQIVLTIRPEAILQQKAGSFILDMGQHMSGWLRFQTKGEKGRVVTLMYGENLNPDGTLDIGSPTRKPETDRFVLMGTESLGHFKQSFSFHKFRYVQVNNWPGEPNKNLFTGEVLGDGMSSTGSFKTSNEDLNQLYKKAWWTLAASYKGVPLDGSFSDFNKPTLARRSSGAVGESYLFDIQRMYAKWMSDIELAQTPEGQLPDAAPAVVYTYSDDVLSASAYFLVPRMLYRQYGDRKVVEHHYPSMKKWMGYMEKRYLHDGLLGVVTYDRGVPPLNPLAASETNPDRLTDGSLIANAYYIRLLQVMQEFAGLLGNTNDQKRFREQEDAMKQAFQHRFFHSEANSYANNTVTANLLPLAFNITPEENRKAVFQHMCRIIEDKDGTRISTGEAGTAWLLQTLSTYGRTDLALRLLTNKNYPGWGYMAECGATTLWETWNADKIKGVSVNHMALMGDMLSWFYENLAGITSASDGPGFKKIILRPDFTEGINSVSASLISMYGSIVSAWTREGIRLYWDVVVPPNTVALIYIPAPLQQIRESDKPVQVAPGVSFLRTEGDRSVLELKSGSYSFDVKR